MMKKFCFLLLGVGMSFSLFAQERVTGLVFEDLNGNGKKERREKGIADVAVSNGVEVVLTDAEGRYSLPIQAGQTVFVVKPADFSLPVNENNLPQFYYIHKPEGSPEGLTYSGSAPTGPLPKSVDFPLLPGAKKTDFTALVFGDPQPYSLEELEYFNRGVVQEVMQIPNLKEMPFGVSLGDIVGDKLDLFPHYAKTIGQVGLPWFSVMGNHDMNFDVEEDALSDETFTATFGPATYAFNEGDAHFIVLENILYPDPRDGKGYWGGMREDQLTWLENNLALVPKDRLVVVFMHIPIFEENGDSFRDADRETLLRLLSPFENSVSFSAHTHYMKQTYWAARMASLRIRHIIILMWARLLATGIRAR
ncbi:metallophosphoesterase N-terminal domain-containing protein [Nitritalea halalkaliphila]|uniref:metallophosphoesterase N-terminal domain-containing protein n=1 Tax=Nitritalea halalkaliphila TaxID=590849 RepID=UPI0003062A0A|nr:metallophosphoesterase N-terminal domain-containing protein [Nitritalea halalkaliphila]